MGEKYVPSPEEYQKGEEMAVDVEKTIMETSETKDKQEKNKPLEGVYREVWAKKLPNNELFIDATTGKVRGPQSDFVRVKKDSATKEWVVVSAKNKVNEWGSVRIPIGNGEHNIFYYSATGGVPLASAPREWSVWSKGHCGGSSFNGERFDAGERGEKTFSDLKSAEDYILDREGSYELRSGNGDHRGEKPFTGELKLSNSYNYGMIIEGKNSGKKRKYHNCARVNSEQETIVLESQQWYEEKTGEREIVVGKLSPNDGRSKYIASLLKDDEVIVEFFRSY